MKQKDYIKCRNVGERLTGKHRQPKNKKFNNLIESLNETVEQILTKVELSEEQYRQASRMGLNGKGSHE